MTEHIEHWEWPTGETMALDVVSVHEIRGGKITSWRDYWDMAVLTAAAPQWWFEHVLQGWNKAAPGREPVAPRRRIERQQDEGKRRRPRPPRRTRGPVSSRGARAGTWV